MLLLISLEFIHEFTSESIFDFREAMKEMGRVVIYVLLINILSKMKINLRTYIYQWSFILFIIVLGAVLQFIKIINIDAYLINFYGYSKQFHNSAQTSLNLFRGGSFFVNPNVFATVLVAYLGSYFSILKYDKLEKNIHVITISLIVIGLVLSGSRTGFIAAIIEILLIFSFLNKNSPKWIPKKNIKSFITIFIIFLVLYSIYNSYSDRSYEEGLRVLYIKQGYDDSINRKLLRLQKVMNQGGILNYLIGYGPFDYSRDYNLMIDFELGFIIAFYGIVGIIFYFGLIYSIIVYKRRLEWSFQKNRNIMFVSVLFLFGISSGVFLNLRLFSILLLLFIVNISVDENIKNEKVRIT